MDGSFITMTQQLAAQILAAAAASADWTSAPDFNLVITNAPGADAWPITATNFILVYKQPKDAAKQQATLGGYDVYMLDTAGRLHIDEVLMDEVQAVRDIAQPRETLLVVDGLIG